MISAGRGEIVDEMIQGDLAESVCSMVATTCSWCCDRWSRCGPVVGSSLVGRGSYNPMGEVRPDALRGVRRLVVVAKAG